jgi:hypothetical protein
MTDFLETWWVIKVAVTNLAREGKSSGDSARRGAFGRDDRAALRSADIVLFGSAAGAALNTADARLQAREC